MIGKFHRFWEQERSLLILLIFLCIHLFVVMPFGERTTFGVIVIFIFYLFVLGAGVSYLISLNRTTYALYVALICVLFLVIALFNKSRWATISSSVSVIIYCGLLAWIVLLKTFSKGPITIYRIEGSIVVYLLIGLMFANIFHLLADIKGESVFKGIEDGDIKEFLYFSFVSLTTVGYGDITPAEPITRTFANLESLIGQLYPAILIARLVSMEFSGKRE